MTVKNAKISRFFLAKMEGWH